jgi:hypothetical protein
MQPVTMILEETVRYTKPLGFCQPPVKILLKLTKIFHPLGFCQSPGKNFTETYKKSPTPWVFVSFQKKPRVDLQKSFQHSGNISH